MDTAAVIWVFDITINIWCSIGAIVQGGQFAHQSAAGGHGVATGSKWPGQTEDVSPQPSQPH
jgi:hypothetical protein